MQSESLVGIAEETIRQHSTSTNDQLTETVQIQDTPFHAVKVNDTWFLALGRYRLSDMHESLEAIQAIVKGADWNLLCNMMYAIATDAINNNTNQKG
jgi:hypothetical protein